MLGYLFDPESMEPDRYNRASTHKEGAWSILTGIAANAAIASGQTVDVDHDAGGSGDQPRTVVRCGHPHP